MSGMQEMTKKYLNMINTILNENDELGIYCFLSGGTLKDYTNHVVDRKKDVWGFLKWENGKSKRVSWQEI